MKRRLIPQIFIVLSAMCAAGEAWGAGPAFWEWAKTPPLGWNSYDVYGDSVNEAETLANAQYMKDHLLAHGWQYIVIDFRWYDPAPVNDDRMLNPTRTGAALAADQYGRMIPAPNRFPSSEGGKGFKPLADKLHAMGLKFGFHMMRGIPRQAVSAKTPIAGSRFNAADAGDPNDKCPWCPDMFGVKANEAGQAWYDAMFQLYASLGLDFVKVDDLSQPYHTAEIEMIRKAIDKCGRPIVFSTSPGATPVAQASHIMSQANMWRISGDFWDRWRSLDKQFDLLDQWKGVAGPGHWPDADMIPFGHVGIRSWIAGWDRWTRFTKDEQMTLMSLWALAPSPMMLGMNLPDNDEWTLSLLTNDEVMAVNQDKLGAGARRVAEGAGTEVWVKELSDGSEAIGLFNRGKTPAVVVANWSDLGLTGKVALRDLWHHSDLGTFETSYSATVAPHGSALVRTMTRP